MRVAYKVLAPQSKHTEQLPMPLQAAMLIRVLYLRVVYNIFATITTLAFRTCGAATALISTLLYDSIAVRTDRSC